MGKKSPYTTNTTIISALRGRVWLRSRERAAALKRENYCCERCGVKQSKAKGKEVAVHVHHKQGINWKGLADDIRARLLPDPSELEVLCKECHEREHDDGEV